MYNLAVTSLSGAATLTFVVLVFLQVAGAQVMSSPSYQLQSDSVNVGGGYSSSSNYTQESTVGEIATGPSDSSSFMLRAGYQQMQEVFLSLTVSDATVTMDTELGGLTGGTSNGSTTFTVITDDPAGYQLTVEAENSPAMVRSGGVDTIADYVSALNPDPDPDFTVNNGEAFLGYTPTGVDIASEYVTDNTSCGTGSNTESITRCWLGLSTTAKIFATDTDANHPSGATTTMHFRVGVGSNAGVTAGLYIATTTVTAIPL